MSSIPPKHSVTQLPLQSGMVQSTGKPSKRQHSARQGRAVGYARNSRLTAAYKKAHAEYTVLLRYLRIALGVLPKAECQLLLEFAEIAKQKCQRMRRAVRPCSRPATA